MKRFSSLLLSALILSCGSGNHAPATDIEAADQFVHYIWKNDFSKAESLLLKDETNKQTFDGFAVYFKRRPQAELDKYQKATLIVNNIKQVNDSVSFVNYSPDFNTGEKNELKVVRTGGKWLVDLKYTIPQTDSTQQ